jgi:hypothetical protein
MVSAGAGWSGFAQMAWHKACQRSVIAASTENPLKNERLTAVEGRRVGLGASSSARRSGVIKVRGC